jgi:cobyrinic acid a,c-diamide synthase
MLAGTKSGSGKTTITCGILKCLVDRGYNVSSFKCGPDYIDPMFHSKVIGTNSANLDSFFTDSDVLNLLLYKNSVGSDISVIEGVMGYYDGIGLTDVASTYSVAAITKTPVILVIDCKGMSSSIAALLKGFVEYKENSYIKGVIFNQLPKVIYQDVKKLAEDLGISVLGYVPTISECMLESRHLGLVTADEIKDIKAKLELLATKLNETIDIEAIVQLSKQAEAIDIKAIPITKANSNINIAVAKDNAFCFTYKDNIDILEQMGCNIVSFSPLKDKKLPENIDGLILSGGYPELYADVLSQNRSMLESIKSAINDGIPTIAECGGFMYLHDSIEDCKGNFYPMAGVIKGKCFKTNRLQRFGYITLEAKEDNLIAEKNDRIKAHEFHYWDSDNGGDGFDAVKASGTKAWECIHATKTLYAGFPHLYFYSNPSIAERFVDKCSQFQVNIKC